MIKVTIETSTGRGLARRATQIARLEVNDESPSADVADYSIKATVQNPDGSTRIVQRAIFGFDRKQWNALGLLAQCLEVLGPDVMKGRFDNELG